MAKLLFQSLVLLFVAIAASTIEAQTKAQLVESKLVWNSAQQVVETDLARWKENWFMVCCESSRADVREGVIRVITSKDGAQWESIAIIESPTKGKLLSHPRICIKPDGQLMLTADGIIPNPKSIEPLPEFGGTVQAMAWYSNDGRSWSKVNSIGKANHRLGKAVWHQDKAYYHARGCICGNSQIVQVLSFNDDEGMQTIHKKPFYDFPDHAALTFERDTGYCLMSRVGLRGVYQTAMLGVAKAPFNQWSWKEIDTRLSYPSLLRLPDSRIMATVGLYDEKKRTSLCELDPNTGKLNELLVLDGGGEPNHVGLIFHDGQLWISYQAVQGGRLGANFARVSIK